MVQVLYCMKIAKPRWAKSLRDGTAWFGSVESYIQKAQKDHNDEQGDAFEGVFARVGRFSDRKSTRLNSSHMSESRMPSSA